MAGWLCWAQGYLEGLNSHPGVERPRWRQAKSLDDLFHGYFLVGALPHQPCVEVSSTGDGGDAAGAVVGQLVHDILRPEPQLQVKIVARFFTADSTLMGGQGHLSEASGRRKVISGLGGKHGCFTEWPGCCGRCRRFRGYFRRHHRQRRCCDCLWLR